MHEVERFWSHVDQSGGPEACWPWTKGLTPQGYGDFRIPTAHVRANRYALAVHLGRPIKSGMQALHTCDNPPCCNPAHLYEGTPRHNADDARTRGRTATGEKNGRHVLTDDQVRELRASDEPLRNLAQRYGVSVAQVSAIQRGKQRLSAGGRIRGNR
jgi:hypothetical protein